jgi:glutathione S-transferase
VIGSWTASVVSLGSGYVVAELGKRPAQQLELYDSEWSPSCRIVREALSELDLEALILPCPHGGTRFRSKAASLAGEAPPPLLVDRAEDRTILGSADIVRHLARTYGVGKLSFPLRFRPVAALKSAAASTVRLGRGRDARPSRPPEKPLALWSFEASPYCRIVREVLTELELPYVLHNVAKGSPSRAAFVERSKKMMVPYLADPNTGREMHESAEIVKHLEQTYGRREERPSHADHRSTG